MQLTESCINDEVYRTKQKLSITPINRLTGRPPGLSAACRLPGRHRSKRVHDLPIGAGAIGLTPEIGAVPEPLDAVASDIAMEKDSLKNNPRTLGACCETPYI
jgi:hypothetical protein